jgi:hypothetical protein
MNSNLGKLFNNQDNQIIFFSVIFTLVFFLLFMPYIERCYNDDKKEMRENLENILNKSIYPIDTNKCSRSCCKSASWPLPEELLENDIQAEELATYVPNNFNCMNGPNNKSGCLCVTQQDMNYLTNKAGNLYQNDNYN